MKKRLAIRIFAVAVISSVCLFGCSDKKNQQAVDAAETEVLLGIDLVSKGNFEEGLAHFQKAIEFNPEHPRAWCGIGTVYRETGRLEEAVEHYLKAIELNPQYTICLDNLGIAYTKMGDSEKALDAFKKAVAADAAYADAHFNMGALLENELGDIEEAIAEFNKYLELSTNEAKKEEVRIHLEKLKSN